MRARSVHAIQITWVTAPNRRATRGVTASAMAVAPGRTRRIAVQALEEERESGRRSGRKHGTRRGERAARPVPAASGTHALDPVARREIERGAGITDPELEEDREARRDAGREHEWQR